MTKVMTEYHKGTTSPTTLAKQFGRKRAEIVEIISEWKDIAKNDVDIRAQAQEILQGAIQHFDLLIDEGWKLLSQADDDKALAVKATAIKTLADMGSKKVEMVQKAGLYDDASLGDELAEMEEKYEVVKKIIKEVTANCDKCKYEVARRLTASTGKVEDISPSIVVEGEVVTNPVAN